MAPPKVGGKKPTKISEADSQAIRPPSLTVCINEKAVGPDRSADGTAALPAGAAVTAANLKTVIDAICTQLTDATFDSVWDTPAGKLPIDPATDDEKLEEDWAKGIDELILGTAYTGPDIIPAFPSKGGIKSPLKYIYSRFSLDPSGTGDFSVPKDPAMSLGIACQHMTSYGLLSRGIPTGRMSGVGVAASQSTAGLPLYKERPGSWYSEDSPTPDAKKDASIPYTRLTGGEAHSAATVMSKVPDYGPGAVYTYNPLQYKRSMLTLASVDDCLHKDGQPVTDGEGNYVLAPAKAIASSLETQKRAKEAEKSASGTDTTQQALQKQEDAALQAKQDAGGSAKVGGNVVVAKMSLAAQLDGSHISMVLRTYKTKAYAPGGGSDVSPHVRVQLLDAGSHVSCPEVSDEDMARNYAMVVPHMENGNGHLCGEGYTTVPGKSDLFVGLGTGTKIEKGAEVKALLAKARHVGVARLAISAEVAKPSESDFYYLSRCIPLWKGDKRFSLARLAWSLRNAPLAKSLRAYWIVYAPRGYLAQVMWAEGARDKSLTDMAKEALELFNADQVDEKKKRASLTAGNDLLPIAIFSSNADGKALQIWRGHCLAASGKGQPPQSVRKLFIATTAPDMTLFKEMEKKFKSEWEAERQRLKEKQAFVKKQVDNDLATFNKSKDPMDLKVCQLKIKHQQAGDYDWFDTQHDRSTYEADLADDTKNGFTGKAGSTKIDTPALAAYHEWAAAPFTEDHAHPLELARNKLDGEYCSLSETVLPHELLK